MTQQPSIGRIVHYQSYGTPGGEYLPEPRAAIITDVRYHVDQNAMKGVEGTYEFADGKAEFVQTDALGREVRTPVADLPSVPLVSLCVLNPTGMFFNEAVPYAAEPTPGHWNWPPRTDKPSTGEAGEVTIYTNEPGDAAKMMDREQRRQARYMR